MSELYQLNTLSDEVYGYYIEETKRGKNTSKECLERKLLAMSLAAPEVRDNGIGCKIYQFGGFNFAIRENSGEVGMLYWSQKPNYVSEENSIRLRELYKLVGISEDGQIIEGPMDEIALEEYCKLHNLSNLQKYRNFREELIKNIL